MKQKSEQGDQEADTHWKSKQTNQRWREHWRQSREQTSQPKDLETDILKPLQLIRKQCSIDSYIKEDQLQSIKT